MKKIQRRYEIIYTSGKPLLKAASGGRLRASQMDFMIMLVLPVVIINSN